MVSFFLIYIIGRSFYNLAKSHEKHTWGFAVLGVLSFYLGSILGGILIALYYESFTEIPVEEVSDKELSLLALPFGLLFCWGLYLLLKKSWNKNATIDHPDILDQ